MHPEVCGSMRDAIMMVDSIIIGIDLEMRSSKRNKLSMVVGVDKSLLDLGENIERED